MALNVRKPRILSLQKLCLNKISSNIIKFENKELPFEEGVFRDIIRKAGSRATNEETLHNLEMHNPRFASVLDNGWRTLFRLKYGEKRDFEKKYRQKWNEHFTWKKLFEKFSQKTTLQIKRAEKNVKKRMLESASSGASSPNKLVRLNGGSAKRQRFGQKSSFHKKTTRGIMMHSTPVTSSSWSKPKANATKLQQIKTSVSFFSRLNKAKR